MFYGNNGIRDCGKIIIDLKLVTYMIKVLYEFFEKIKINRQQDLLHIYTYLNIINNVY